MQIWLHCFLPNSYHDNGFHWFYFWFIPWMYQCYPYFFLSYHHSSLFIYSQVNDLLYFYRQKEEKYVRQLSILERKKFIFWSRNLLYILSQLTLLVYCVNKMLCMLLNFILNLNVKLEKTVLLINVQQTVDKFLL